MREIVLLLGAGAGVFAVGLVVGTVLERRAWWRHIERQREAEAR